jgi:hypothetical protein
VLPQRSSFAVAGTTKEVAMSAPNVEQLIPDLGEAERHLTGLDETAERFLFCTFDDVKLPDGKKRESKVGG